MNEALRLANQAQLEDEVPVGAVVVHESQIIGVGYNRREQNQDPLAHAEILAIQDASKKLGSWRLIDCSLIVTLEPCPMCLAACQQARIKEVIYGAHDKKGGALSLGYELHKDLRTHHRFEVNYQETQACSEILTHFFSKKRSQSLKQES